MRPIVHILILAAGSSSRMRGTDKLIQPVGGKPLLRHIAEVALATGMPVTVMLPCENAARRDALAGLAVDALPVPDAAEGMSRALRRGVEAISGKPAGPDDGVMVLPADMPGFTTDALNRMIAAFQHAPGTVLRGASETGQPGHPAIFPHDLWTELAGIEGDEGGRSVVQRLPGRVRLFTLPGAMAVLDLDTPEDWAAYQAPG